MQHVLRGNRLGQERNPASRDATRKLGSPLRLKKSETTHPTAGSPKSGLRTRKTQWPCDRNSRSMSDIQNQCPPFISASPLTRSKIREHYTHETRNAHKGASCNVDTHQGLNSCIFTDNRVESLLLKSKHPR